MDEIREFTEHNAKWCLEHSSWDFCWESEPPSWRECTRCGYGPIYQDRIDAGNKEAHCDTCGHIFTEEEYKQIIEKR